MRIDEPWEHDPAGGIDDEIAMRHGISGTAINDNDVTPFDDNSPVLDNAVALVHREHEPVFDRDARHWQYQSFTAAP